MATKITRTGYVTVGIYVEGQKRYPTVHSLVAQAFLGPRPVGYEVNHKDMDRANNRVENLEYVTKTQNQIYAQMHSGKYLGKSHGCQVLTAEIVQQMRREYIRVKHRNGSTPIGISMRFLARKYGVDRSTISDAINGKSWAWLPQPASS